MTNPAAQRFGGRHRVREKGPSTYGLGEKPLSLIEDVRAIARKNGRLLIPPSENVGD
jgi:hypothetical protein